MAEQQYCLRWNNHQQNFITIFKNLLDFEELVDVTISVEGKQIKAHKVVLSACSPYFKTSRISYYLKQATSGQNFFGPKDVGTGLNLGKILISALEAPRRQLLFSITPSKHPIVILNDIKYKDMKTIIDFIYCGEVSINDEELADILEIAETLQVSGLYDPKQNKRSPENVIENPTKKIKRKSENNSPDLNMTTGPNGPDIGSVDPINWYGNEPVTEYQANSLLQDYECNSYKNLVLGFKNLATPDTSHYIPSSVPSTTPARRRNSKVQESENFLLALEAVRSGKLGFCKAAKLYGLNNRTLWLEYKKRGYPATRPPVRKVHEKPNT